MKYNKQKLIAKLPKLKKKHNVKLQGSTISGLMAGVMGPLFQHYVDADRKLLVDQHEVESSWFYGRQWAEFPDKDVDLMKTNYTRRKLVTFGKNNMGFRKSVNKDLAGGEQTSPLLITLLGIGAGIASFGAGLLYTGFTLAVTYSMDPQPVRAREGDEVHQLEYVGVENDKIYHVEHFILIDPFRAKAKRRIQQWVIHEKRTEIRLY